MTEYSNPIYKELLNLKLIKKKDIIKISNKTRDSKVKVLKDKKTKIIFLEKFITNKNYYSSKKSKKNFKIANSRNSTFALEDNKRRIADYQRLCKNKTVLDFGCGWGHFLKKLIKPKSLNGVELRKDCIEYLKKSKKNINIKTHVNDFSYKFDIITMFHVLEHLPNQIKSLKLLRNKLKKNGKIIIEVPHAKDILLHFVELKEFKNFTFWSEHLILHTYLSLKTIIKKAGFKDIKISYTQRYGFDNHLGWFIKKKPNGHIFFKKYSSKNLNSNYKKNLINLKKTDTLTAVATK